jgi:hypothetical protein
MLLQQTIKGLGDAPVAANLTTLIDLNPAALLDLLSGSKVDVLQVGRAGGRPDELPGPGGRASLRRQRASRAEPHGRSRAG